MKGKGYIVIAVVLLLIGGVYFYYAPTVSANRVESPSGIGESGLWGEEVQVEYVDGTYGTIKILDEPLSVIHNDKEVAALRYILSSYTPGDGLVVINLASFEVQFKMGTHTYEYPFTESAIVIPMGDWHEIVWPRIDIDDITAGVPTGTYNMKIQPSGTISYTMNDLPGSATLPINITDTFKVDTPTPPSNTYTLTMITNGAAFGYTSPAAGTYTYDADIEVPVSAIPFTNCQFDGWSGASSSTNRNITIVMDSNKTLTATFTQTAPTDYILTISLGTGSGTTDPSIGPHTYAPSTNVVVNAIGNPGYTFSDWDGAYDGTLNPCTITMNGNRQLTANFVDAPPSTYTLNIIINGQGSVVKNPNKQYYDLNEVVQLTATGALGWQLSAWSGGGTSGNQNPISVTMNADKTVTATFVQIPYTLTVNIVGSGSVAKSINPPYYYGDIVTLTETPANDWLFSAWSGAASGSTPSVQVTMTSDKTVTATFIVINYFILVSSPNGGESWQTGISYPIYWSTNISENVKIELSANSGSSYTETIIASTPGAAGYYSWNIPSGHTLGTQFRVRITGLTHTSVYDASNADFTITTKYTLGITINPTGWGTVTLNPTQPSGGYAPNTVVTLTASGTGSNLFDHWTGDLTGNANPTTITMTSNKAVTAVFSALPTYILTITTIGSGTVTPASGTSYPSGTVVTVTATAASGWSFSSWGGDLSGNTNPTTITMNSAKTISATFTLNTLSYLDLTTFDLVNENPSVTTYTISNGLGTNSKVTIMNMDSDDPTKDCFLRYTFPVGYFGANFVVDFTATVIDTNYATQGYGGCLLFTNASYIRSLHDGYYVQGGHTQWNYNANGFTIGYWNNGGDVNRTNVKQSSSWLCDYNGTSWYQGFPNAPNDGPHFWGPHYYRVTRMGNMYQVGLYTDVSRTTLDTQYWVPGYPSYAPNPKSAITSLGNAANQQFNYLLVGFGRGGYGGPISYSVQDVRIVSH